MARPAIFPLPDDLAKRIIAAVDALARDLPPGGPSRPFLAAFIPEIYRITGKVYGHSTYRQILELYAPAYRPSSDTLRAEIDAFREKLVERAPNSDPHPSRSARRHAPESTERMPPRHQHEASAELARLQLLEIDRLRREHTALSERAARAEVARQELAGELAAEKARADTLEAGQATLQTLVKDLTATIERTQAQADGSHRHSLRMVEQARDETRQQAAIADQWRQRLAAKDSDLRAAQATIDALKRRVNDLLAKIPGSA
jgi:hypothetical protein